MRQLLQQPTIASDEVLTQQYDTQVRTSTVAGPGSDAGIIRIRGYHKGLAMTTDGNGRFVYLDPEIGGQMAVTEAMTNIIASGAEPLAITDCLNYGDPNDPEIFWELHHSIQGMADACRVFDTPVISGNVSLYNENNGNAIYPTPMVGMVGLIKNLDHVIPSFATHAGDAVYLIGKTGDDYAGSELQKMLNGDLSGTLPALDLQAIHEYCQKLHQQMVAGNVTAAHDVSEGGLGVALAEMLFQGETGMQLDLRSLTAAQLFSETAGRLVVTVPADARETFENEMGQDAQYVGQVTNTHWLELHLQNAEMNENLTDLKKLYKEALPCQLKSKD